MAVESKRGPMATLSKFNKTRKGKAKAMAEDPDSGYEFRVQQFRISYVINSPYLSTSPKAFCLYVFCAHNNILTSEHDALDRRRP
jgi:hypothetical protein